MKCTIIASGSSLRGFDFTRIKGDTFGINYVYDHIPIELDNAVMWDKHSALNYNGNATLHTLKEYDIFDSEGWINSGKEELILSHDKVGQFNSSLCFALNIVLNLGYNDIVILGADNHAKDYLHFYDREVDKKGCERYSNSIFLLVDKYMKKIKKGLTGQKITMVESKIDCFENIGMDEYLK